MDKKIFVSSRGIFHPVDAAGSGVVAALGALLWMQGGWLFGPFLVLAGGATMVISGAQLLCTRYVLYEGCLEVRSGFSKIDVLYEDMEWFGREKSQAADGYVPMALTRDAVYIYFHSGEKLYRLELSPRSREEFEEELVRLAPHLKG